MTISLPLVTMLRPLVRLLYRTYSSTLADGDPVETPGPWGPWKTLPMAQRLDSTRALNGFYVDKWSRVALPMIGEATLRYRKGIINGRVYSGEDEDGNAIPPNLRFAELRIQVAPAPVLGSDLTTFTPAWRTCWIGQVEHQVDNPSTGERTYHCFDSFFRAKRWQLTKHTAYVDGQIYEHVAGHPGYNMSLAGYYARTLGNREDTGVTCDPFGDIADSGVTNRYYAHCWPHGISGEDGAAAKWNDKQVIEHALQSSRGKWDPVWEVRGQTHLLEGTSSWLVTDGMYAWDLVAAVANRRRGRGLVFFDFEDDTLDPDGDIVTFLTVRPQFKEDLEYTPPGASPITLTGAATAEVVKSIDLAGDHRLVPGSLSFGDRLQYRMGYVENRGEYIEVLVTVDYAAQSLAKRWTDADATAFKALAAGWQRGTARWDPVYQRHGIPTDWDCKTANGNGGARTRCDYQTSADGSLYLLEVGTDDVPGASSPLMVRISNDLPVYEGYDYTNAVPARYDGADEQIAPPRRPVMGFAKTASNRYLDLSRIGFQLQIDPAYGVYLKYGDDQSDFTTKRFFSEAGVNGRAYDYTAALLTVGLTFGNRVRMWSGDPDSRRRLIVDHQGLSLWVAHPGAIWELDRSSPSTAEAPAKRAAGAGTTNNPGILRDDRAALAQQHALTCVWYLEDHITVNYSQRACVFLPNFTSNDEEIEYPQLGDFIDTVTFTNRLQEEETTSSQCPVTALVYDFTHHRSDVVTDWSDLDFVTR